MKLGILGGSFNPVHNGHMALAEAAINELKLDRVVLVPAYRSPFKLDISGMKAYSAVDRIKMLAAAVAADPRFSIDDCEIKREGISYTVNTLEDIIARYMPEGKPYLIIGDDLAADFPKWREYERILELAEIVIGKRTVNSEQLTVNSEQKDFSFPHILLNNEIIDISSSMIRAGKIQPFAPLRRLEREPSGTRCERSFDIENEARETLSVTRFLHSRHTAVLAYDMCRRFGLNPQDGYLAGIAHDLAKEFDSKKMIKLAKKDGMPFSSLEKDKPNLLHGRAAAVLLREQFNIKNKEILEAVAVHTTGSENMGPLAKVVYIADKAEVSRNIEAGLRKMCYNEELDSTLLAVINKAAVKLQSKKLEMSLETKNLLEKLKIKGK